ncbi:QsdR family transcriptional regulator [Actinoplanes sp. TRM 88003]|uniref:QsdR family transcriptional regulator n=1 Tax=Paractinoplanes aksuensis TaxID=2939490 RepID=A0ABT1DLD0_9ACTN|nr:QsdR family transcriptional regulator [Actinoplanes aksuensis]MCO8270566.1 QsdR family transcriptional regulator [Actinoplanes aksuensis]
MAAVVGEEKASRRVVTHDQVVRAGVDQFLGRSTIDMEALAAGMAISRATLYRVAGSRDALLDDVLRALTEVMFAESRAARRAAGFDGVVEISRHFGEQLRSPVLETFLWQEPEAASRVLFTPAGGVHESAVANQIQIFRETGLADDLPPGTDLPHLAFLYVRMVGAFFYAEFFTGRPSDFDELVPALRSLMTAAP